MTSEVSLGAGGAKMAGADSKLADVVRTPREHMRGAELCSDDVAFIEEIHRSSGGSVYAGRDRRTGAAVILKVARAPTI